MDFVRQILLEIEKRNPEASNPGVDVDGRTPKEILHHLEIMDDIGLVAGVRSNPVGCVRMTWEGYEFLEQTRDPDRWEEVKQTAVTTTKSLSWLAIKTVISTWVASKITSG